MKILATTISLLAVLLVLGTSPPVYATHSTPFNGHMSGNSIAVSEISNNITATVYLDHLGKSHLVGTTTVTGRNECGGFVGTEKDTITAANGDEIHLLGSGTSCPKSPTIFQDTVTFTITSGNGRFADARGSGTIHTTIIITSLTTAMFNATINGQLTS